MTDRDIQDLCPQLQILYREWLMQCHEEGLAARAIVTWRSGADQDAAKAQGLSNAAAGQSPHNCCNADGTPGSRAFDFAIFDHNAAYVRDGTDPRYRQAGEIAKKLGLAWGGDWHHPDYDHIEMHSWKTPN